MTTTMMNEYNADDDADGDDDDDDDYLNWVFFGDGIGSVRLKI